MGFEISNNSSRISVWNSLPSDLWVEIFSHLNVSTVLQMASVCKKFREMVNNSKLLWQKLSLRNFNSIHITKESLIKDARFLTDLNKEKGKLRCVQAVKIKNSEVSAICFHKGNLITGTKENFVRYWKLDAGFWKSVDEIKLEDEVTSFFCIEDKLFVGSNDGIINLFDLNDYAIKSEKVLKKKHTFYPFIKAEGQRKAVGAHTIFFGDGHLFCAADSGMKIYENKKDLWEKPLKLNYPGILTTFSYKNGTLYCGNIEGEISIYNKDETDHWVQTLSFEAHGRCVVSKISWDGDLLISTGEDGAINRWKQEVETTLISNGDVESKKTWKCMATLTVQGNSMLEDSYPTNVIFFPDFPDAYIVTLSTDPYIYIHLSEGDDFESHYVNDDDGLITILSYNLGQLFSCNERGEISVWEVDVVPNQPNKKLKTNY